MKIPLKDRKFRLLLDMDDVIVETLQQALNLYYRRYGVLYFHGNVDNWTSE